jgi:PAS domain S-box-containing protein
MYSFNFFSVLSLTSAIIYLIIAVYILFRNPKGLANRLFALVGLSMVVWGFGEGMMRASIDAKQALFWATYVTGLGSALHPPLLLHFWLVFSGWIAKIKNKFLIIALYVPGIIFIILRFISPAILIKNVTREYWGYSTQGTPLYLLYMVFIVSYILLVSFMAFKTSAKMSDDLKKQARNIGFAILACAVIALITQVSRPLLNLPLPEMSVAGTLIFICVIAYAVNKYGFLVITTGLVAENIIATMDDYVIAIDKNINIALINNSVLIKLGYEKNELLNKPLSLLLSSDTGALSYEQLAAHLTVSDYQAILLAKNGEKIPISANISLIKGGAGESTGFVFVLRDMRKFNELIINLQNKTTELETSKTETEKSKLELQERNNDLEKINKLMIDRELKMIEMKNEIAKLKGDSILSTLPASEKTPSS